MEFRKILVTVAATALMQLPPLVIYANTRRPAEPVGTAPSTFKFFRLPTPGAGSQCITVGRDGEIWFTEQLANKIGLLSLSHFIEFTVPTSDSEPDVIVQGPRGSIWFTEVKTNNVGRLTRDGHIKEFVVAHGERADGIVAGPDGAMWITEGSGVIGRMTMDGQVTQYPIPWYHSWPMGITTGSDGALWFADYGTSSIGRVTTNGEFTQYRAFFGVTYIVSASDGALWASGGLNVGRMTVDGSLSEIVLDGVGALAPGPNGDVWMPLSTPEGASIVRILPSGTFTAFEVPVSRRYPYAYPQGVTTDSKGRLWFVDEGFGGMPDRIARMSVRTP